MESQPSSPMEGTQVGDGGPQGSAPPPASIPADLTPEQLEAALESREDLKRWDQSRLDRRAAAQAEAWNRQTEAQRLADARKAEDERWGRLDIQRALADEGRADPLEPEDQKWYQQHQNTRLGLEARAEVLGMWANDYDGARAKNKQLPDFREYAHRTTGELIEDIFQTGFEAGKASVTPEIDKLAEAKAAEKMDQHRGTLPNPEVARTATNGSGINTIGDLMALSSADRYALKRDNPALYNRLTAQATRG